jgi:hypothetical protein
MSSGFKTPAVLISEWLRVGHSNDDIGCGWRRGGTGSGAMRLETPRSQRVSLNARNAGSRQSSDATASHRETIKQIPDRGRRYVTPVRYGYEIIVGNFTDGRSHIR